VITDTEPPVVDSAAPPDGKLLLTVEEAAHRLGIGRTVMYRLVSTGAVESVTVGRLRRIPSECLDEFVSMLRRAQASGRRARMLRPGSGHGAPA
jgi:excisionase family DNA binding protein